MSSTSREALLRYAGGPEEFLAMRSRFAVSLAALSATNYIAGVGDRHLDNYLLVLSSGELVPIDFGCVRKFCQPLNLDCQACPSWARSPCLQQLRHAVALSALLLYYRCDVQEHRVGRDRRLDLIVV